jgi:hypothetical protein
MPGRWPALFAALALGLIVGGCAGAEESPPPRQAPAIVTTPARCDVGERPGYFGPGRRGFYIPAICALEPLSRFAVRDAAQLRQGVNGYALVIWGTAGESTGVVARFSEGTARATIIQVGPEHARNLGVSPFRLFVMELPLSAACAAVTVAANGAGATERIPAKTRCGAGVKP